MDAFFGSAPKVERSRKGELQYVKKKVSSSPECIMLRPERLKKTLLSQASRELPSFLL